MKYIYDVTISLVHYKTPDVLIACIQSIYKHTKRITFEIIMLDNNSRDSSVAKVRRLFPKVRIIVSKVNTYATKGNNIIFKRARGKYFLVLNPDIEFLENAILKMATFLNNHKQVAAVSCKQIKDDGTVDFTCSRFSTPLIEILETRMIGNLLKNNNLLLWYHYAGWDRSTTLKVEVIPDTIMLIRHSIAQKLNLYDENILLYFMENDLCKRIYNLGFFVYHLGTVSVVHLRGESTRTFTPKAMYYIYERDMLYYYKKYFGFWWMLALLIIFQSNRLYYVLEPFITRLRGRN